MIKSNQEILLINRVTELNRCIDMQQKELQTIKDKVQFFTHQQSELRICVNSLHKEKNKLKLELNELENSTTCKQLKAIVKSLKKECSTLAKRKSNLGTSDNNVYEKKYALLSGEINDLKNRLTTVTDKNVDVRMSLGHILEKLIKRQLTRSDLILAVKKTIQLGYIEE